MAKASEVKGFPEITNKLGAPTKKSLFERQKAEAEAKRQREQEETAAVYEDFVKSFDDEGDSASTPAPAGRAGPGAGGFSKRHFSGPSSRGGIGSQRSSGPGSLGPAPPSLSKNRSSEFTHPVKKEGLFAFEDESSAPVDPRTALQHSDDDQVDEKQRREERAVPRPTLRLSSLPPGTSPAAIKAIIPPTLSVEGVRILPPAGPGTNASDRRSVTAIVTLTQDTPALDIDTVVSALQNRYMGRGYYLSLSRHLSSTAVTLETPRSGLTSSISSLPFGARPIVNTGLGRGASSNIHRGGFAPPASFAPPPQGGRGAPQVQVTVTPPSDLKQLKLIHKTLEAVLRHGPEFEALLMTRREIQHEQKWAWLWDSRSVGGVYYRWRLWEIFSGANRRRRRTAANAPVHMFENGAVWVGPEQKLPYEYTTHIDEIVSDSDYHSSEDEDSGDEARRRYAQHHGGAPPPDGPLQEAETQSYLNPLQKAKLTHLLARLPDSNAKLRRGDVARVTAFAIQHAGEGSDEVVQMVVSNATKPFSCTSANPDYQAGTCPADEDEDNDPYANESIPIQTTEAREQEDNSTAKLVALYVISDILSSSSTSGVRHAWRYRSAFETQLKRQRTFEHLGRLEKMYGWGRLRAEKWKRSVNSILALWEGWCVFPQETQDAFKAVFNDPPLTKEEEAEKEAEEEAKKVEQAKKRWKSVEERNAEREAEKAAQEADGAELEDGDAMEIDGVDGEDLDEEVDGEPLIIEKELGRKRRPPKNIDGTPMQEDGTVAKPSVNGAADKRAALAASIAAKLGKTHQATVKPPEEGAAPGVVRKRQRPKAEDMFASDEE